VSVGCRERVKISVICNINFQFDFRHYACQSTYKPRRLPCFTRYVFIACIQWARNPRLQLWCRRRGTSQACYQDGNARIYPAHRESLVYILQACRYRHNRSASDNDGRSFVHNLLFYMRTHLVRQLSKILDTLKKFCSLSLDLDEYDLRGRASTLVERWCTITK
jgi:hypothetical protein